ncbi:hypothetical protein [Nostoc sp. UHCC 0302]|uniref:hypothetical protein n=1 Tax=Nostoc sp. UHCC 0302 TaxID=3134896 RepID=UPI00311C8B3C
MVTSSGFEVCVPAKKSTTFREKRQKFQPLHTIPIYPGVRKFYYQVNLTQNQGFGRCNLAVYWKRKYRGKQEPSPWYLATNLSDVSTTVKIYKQRFGIEAMFRDCKTGDYNLEGSQPSLDRLVRIILLIALSWLNRQIKQCFASSIILVNCVQQYSATLVIS